MRLITRFWKMLGAEGGLAGEGEAFPTLLQKMEMFIGPISPPANHESRPQTPPGPTSLSVFPTVRDFEA